MTPVRFALPLLLIGMMVPVARGQTSTAEEAPRDTIVTRVATAFTNGDAQRLLTPAADRVEVSLFGTRTFYSNAQAFYVLRDFFDEHVPQRFTVQDVTETETSCFVTGTYQHVRSERALQVYVRLTRPSEKTWQLHEVRISASAE